MLHINPVMARLGFVRKIPTGSLNKRLRLGDLSFYRLRLLASFLLVSTVPAQAANAGSFTPGYWISSGREITLQIVPCGGDLCGFISGIALKHMGDPMPLDWRGKPQCGFLMLRVSPAQAADDGTPRWKGVLQDPRNGDVYRMTMRFDTAGNLDLRGYIGLPLLGQTEVWPKFTGEILPGCHMPKLDGK